MTSKSRAVAHLPPAHPCPICSASGDLSNGCASAGPHFNPFDRTHGAPHDLNRHVGDLGNIAADAAGVASFSFEDSLISLNGPLSIVGCVYISVLVFECAADECGYA